ncbi:putative ATP-binding cassette transporter [Rhodococcus rhodochrous J45]|uniref:Putative ATP-binding cassette transporter n=1 Tax=Rhodococcus rhodochrous J45 TaxID=935266 RepID=A0A562EP47_RHORH|nr:ATP-binding cassette domain-containing protein [Rhodococcus rhodochrous]TWH23531.1 putative ATP-binding cassette transporter [Rhodococcus rhodochrous J45]
MLDWGTVVVDSVMWTAKAFAITALVFVAVIAALVRFTRWGRQWWRIATSFFDPRNGAGGLVLAARGEVDRPTGDGLFLSQHPYLPLGTLRDAVTYPRAADHDDAALRTALETVALGHLAERLDTETDWARTLSAGEQQRLGFARILLSSPAIVFLDEATAAVDEGLEHALYRTMREALPDAVIVSVGHRSTLDAFHDRVLELRGEGRWVVSDLEKSR